VYLALTYCLYICQSHGCVCFQDIFVTLCQLDSDKYFMCNIDEFKFFASMIEHVPLPLRARYVFSCAPIPKSQPFVCTMLLKVIICFTSFISVLHCQNVWTVWSARQPLFSVILPRSIYLCMLVSPDPYIYVCSSALIHLSMYARQRRSIYLCMLVSPDPPVYVCSSADFCRYKAPGIRLASGRACLKIVYSQTAGVCSVLPAHCVQWDCGCM